MTKKVLCSAVILVFTLFAGSVFAGLQENMEKLGGLLYRDTNLSLNQNQSCKTCHHPSAGFADPQNRSDPIGLPVSDGSDPTLFGGRNAPSAAYAGFSPVFVWDSSVVGYAGGMFWDGRASGLLSGDPLAEQALQPFLNPKEMGMTEESVVAAVAASHYSRLFVKIFPDTDFTDVQGTFNNIGKAIAAFERSMAVTRFNSKFDQFWQACRQRGIDISLIDMTTDLSSLPSGILTDSQLKGLALFNDAGKGNCAACHTTTNYTDVQGTIYPPLFTDFSYDNLGIPINWRVYELAGGNPPDLGLGGREDIAAEDPLGLQLGKFKVPTLRNVAKSPPYGHNGYFPTLSEIVNFYNTRDLVAWDEPEVAANVNTDELGNLGLTRQEEWQIVAFLRALTDN